MSQPMSFDYAQFSGASQKMKQDGQDAASSARTAVSSYSSPAGTSPVGAQISLLSGQLQGGLSQSPMQLDSGATQTDSATQNALGGIENQDAANAAQIQGQGLGGSEAANALQGLPAGMPTGGENPLDPESIDKEAQAKAKDMMSGDQASQQMMQMLQMGGQMGGQIAQQLAQQVQQFTQQLNQQVQQVGQQMSQMVSKAVEGAAKSAADSAIDTAVPDLGLGGGGLGGGGGGGGMPDPGITQAAGLGSPVTPMTTSSALVQPGSGSPAAPPASSTPGGRMPGGMMPMIPPHMMRGAGGGQDDSVKRDPKIFPERKLFEGPPGSPQNFGANPDIDDEPPFEVDERST
ncbi:hypothetical protein ACNQR7_31705 [Mycolicibacterium senegalense]|uniref:hypothetical protein n=1 Tax=Mycolicibacterium senegalense TaxID=1796 RepID=UPI003AABA2FD